MLFCKIQKTQDYGGKMDSGSRSGNIVWFLGRGALAVCIMIFGSLASLFLLSLLLYFWDGDCGCGMYLVADCRYYDGAVSWI